MKNSIKYLLESNLTICKYNLLNPYKKYIRVGLHTMFQDFIHNTCSP